MGGTDQIRASGTHARESFDSRADALSADLDDIGPSGLGAKRAKIIASKLTVVERGIILFTLFVFGFAYGLENLLRVVYQVRNIHAVGSTQHSS